MRAASAGAAIEAGAAVAARAATETAVTEMRRAQGRLVIGGGPLASLKCQGHDLRRGWREGNRRVTGG
ncbi:hypothetical protein EASAB2608_03906 [Streptomyces sp. EAS-AB2608]|nr:hypothetical protein EASAB2608_03906 [Streptomyces sp. EAS-AB2608]